MSPRPLPASNSEFEPALDLARGGRFADAVREIEKILKRADAPDGFTTAAALALAAVSRLAEAAQDLVVADQAMLSAVRLRPQFADLQHRRACVCIARGQRVEARRALEKAIAINPKFVAARVELAMLDAREGMIGEALAALRELSGERAVGDTRAFSQGIKRLEHAEWDEAETLLRRALMIGDPGLNERLDRFHAHMRAQEPAQAVLVLREVLPRHEGYPDLHHLLGMAELRLGHTDDALASLGRALELNPEFHEARFHFALALDAAGMTATAMDQMNLVVVGDPHHRGAREWMRVHTARQHGSASRRS